MQNSFYLHSLHALWTEMVDGLVFGTFQLSRSLLPDIPRPLLLLSLSRVGEGPGVQRKCLKLMEELKNLCRCKLSVSTPGFFLPLPPTFKCIQGFMFVAKTFKSWILNLYFISNLSQNSKLRTSSGLPSDSAELFPLLFCRLNEII